MAQTIADLLVRIGADTSELRKQLNATKRQMNSAFGGAALDLSKGIVAGAAAAGAAIGGLGVYAVKLASQMENTKIAFTTMLGSAEKAGAFIKDLQNFAAHTPFEFKGLTESASQMMAYGIAAKDVIPTLTAVGNAVAAVGGGQDKIARVTTALGQMYAKGTVQAEEMRQLTEAGIPAWELLAKTLNTDVSGAMDMVSKRQVDAANGVAGLVSGMNERFGGMMEKQSKTVTGAFSNLMDGLEMAAISAGTKISESLNLAGVLSGLADKIDQVNQVIQKGGGIGDVLKTLIPPELQPAIVAVAGALMGAMVPGLVAMATAAIAAVAPLAPFIAAGAALAVVVWALVDPIGAAKSIMDVFGVSAEKQGEVLAWLQDPIGKLTSAWDNLVGRLKSGAQGIIDSISGMVDRVKQKFNDLKNSLPSISLPSFGFAAGGLVRGYASGGKVHGPGSGTSDSVPAMLSNGEYVVSAGAVNRVGVGTLNAINNGQVSGFAGGGMSEGVAAGDLAGSVLSQMLATPADVLAEELENKSMALEGFAVKYGEAISSANAANEEGIKSTKNWHDVVTDYAKEVGSQFGDCIADIITGQKSAKEAFADFLKNLLKNAAQIVSRWVGIYLMYMAFGLGNPKAAAQAANQTVFGIKAATGGYISGPGTGTSDSIPARLSNGEYVMSAAAVDRIGTPLLDAMNRGSAVHYAGGGLVSVNNGGGSGPAAVSSSGPSVSLQVSALDASSFGDFLSRGGLDQVKQALFEDDRRFASSVGVW